MFDLTLHTGDWSWLGPSKADHSEAAAARFGSRRLLAAAFLFASVTFAVIVVALEIRSSWLEARVLPSIAQHATFCVKPSTYLGRPGRGPYDQRLGSRAFSPAWPTVYRSDSTRSATASGDTAGDGVIQSNVRRKTT